MQWAIVLQCEAGAWFCLKMGTVPNLNVFLPFRLCCSVPIQLVSRTCWLTCRESPCTATSSTSAAKSKPKSRTSEESSSSQGYVLATSASTQYINNRDSEIWMSEKAAAAFLFNISNWMLFALILKSLPAKLVLHRIEVHTLRCAEGRWNKTQRKSPDCAVFFFSAGQRYFPHPGRQESDERRGPDGQGFVRGFHQVPEGVRNSGSQFSRSVMAHEGAREEAAREEGEAWGVSDPGAPRLAEETHLTGPSPQRVQGHGLFLIQQVARKKKFLTPQTLRTPPDFSHLSLLFLSRLLFAAYPVPRRGKGVAVDTISGVLCTTKARYVEERGMCLLLELQCHSCGV